MFVKEVSMYKVKEILRLRFESKLSQRKIGASLGISYGVVNKYIVRAKEKGYQWPLPEGMTEVELKNSLKGKPKCLPKIAEPDYPIIHQELKRKGITIQLLWEEYKQANDDKGVSYSQFCLKYRKWRKHQKISMRQVHKAGDKLFIDYCGPTVDILDPETGEIRPASIFVATLGASNYTYVEATWNQSLPNWIASHERAFRFFGGVPALLVPDNLKSAVSNPCRYDPEINRTYADFVAHYKTAVLPARPYKPKDKSKVENAVLVVERWILARIRHQTFVGLAELNIQIKKLLDNLNERPFKSLPGCRRSQFESIDRPELRPLPLCLYDYAEFKKVRVNFDYHAHVYENHYSVPYGLVQQQIEARITTSTIEFFHNGNRVSSHVRKYTKGESSTHVSHMPKSHQKHMDWTPGRFISWAKKIGEATESVVLHQLDRPHPEQGYRACLGLLSLSKKYSKERVNEACKRAAAVQSPNIRSISSILKKRLDSLPLEEFGVRASGVFKQHPANIQHENIRGSDYYQ